MSTTISVTIVEDDIPLRQTLVGLIRSTPGMTCTGGYSDSKSAQRGMLLTRPDVSIVDLALPGGDGLEILRFARDRLPRVRFLVYSQYADHERVIEAVRTGARGYVSKASGPAQLIEAVRALYAGDGYFPPSIAKTIGDELQKPAGSRETPNPDWKLTPREREVLDLASRGLEHKTIATKLGREYNTIRKHFDNIRAKMRVHTVREAVARYLGRRADDLHPPE